jgi:hypothetical protein
MILWTSSDIPCRSSGCDPTPACVASGLAPMGNSSPTWFVGCHRAPCPSVASLLSATPPPAPTPAADSNPSVPSSPQNDPSNIVRARRHESKRVVSSLKNKYRTSRAGVLDNGVKMIF